MKSVIRIVLFLLSVDVTFAAQTISIPCLDATGTVKNADPASVCKSILPKCTDLKKKLMDSSRDMLEWKIYGYYHLNMDLKLDSSSRENPQGDSMPYPLCSVVGHKLKAASEFDKPLNLELTHQTIGKKAYCGDDPKFINDKRKYKTKISYEGEYGKRWFSYVLGAYPWEIRANAYDVFAKLKDDLSNLGEVIHASSLSEGAQNALEEMKKNVAKLSDAAKASCKPAQEDIVANCLSGNYSITDPVQRLCTLAKAQLALNETAMPNIMVYEVMERTKKMHKRLFGNLFNESANPIFKDLLHHCTAKASKDRTLGKILGWTEIRHLYSCTVSCLVGGKEIYTYENWISGENNEGGKNRRKCQSMVRYGLNASSAADSHYTYFGGVTSDNLINLSKIPSSPGVTFNGGFAGMIEAIIRLDVCQQKGGKTGENKCDLAKISDKPLAKR